MHDESSCSAAPSLDLAWNRRLQAYAAGIPAKLCLPMDQWLKIGLLGLVTTVVFMVAHPEDFHYIRHYPVQGTPSGILRFTFYLGTYFFQCMLLGKLLFSDRAWIRYAGLGLLFPLMILHFSYAAINGTALGLAEVDTIFREGAGMGKEAILAFRSSILRAVPKAGLLVGVLGLISLFFRIRFSTWKAFLLSLSFPAMLVIFSATDFDVISFPLPFRMIGLFALHGMVKPYTGVRDPVAVVPARAAYRKHLILIVDESVRGDHLWINGYPRDTTPFLASLGKSLGNSLGNSLGDGLVNAGICASASNCSCSSNQILLGCLMAKDIPIDVDRMNRMPTLFDYAKRAGFRTVCLDTQDNSREYLLPNMRPSLDQKYTVAPEVAKHQRDRMGLAWLANELQGSAPTFLYVIKNGAHFRYEEQVPPGELEKQPFGPIGKKERRDELVNLYDTVVRWACDDYLKQVYEICKDKDALVIYTSDHGQNIRDDPQVACTHCVARQPDPEQANVPLLAFDFGAPKQADPRLVAHRSAGFKASHFQIAPTLLRAMGYDKTYCAERFGPDLFTSSTASEPPVFFSGGITRKELCFGTGRPLLKIGAPSFANAFIDKPAYCPPPQTSKVRKP